MAYLIFYLTNLIARFKRGYIYKKTDLFPFVDILDMTATTNVLMMRLSYWYICRAPLNINTHFFCRVIFAAWEAGGSHSYNILLHHILMKWK